MSLANSGNTVLVKASDNVFTALVAVATVGAILGLVIVYMRAETLFGGLL